MRWFDFLRRRRPPGSADETRADRGDGSSEPVTDDYGLDEEAEGEFAHSVTVDLAADGVLDGDLDP